MAASKPPAEILDVGGVEVRLSSPDKIVFPELGAAGGTKRHVVQHYRTVAEHGAILTALRDRPTYLQRFPDGITGEEVYQKRVPAKHPEHLQTVTVTFPSGRSADALRPTQAADIVWAAQMGTVTFHPWHARAQDVDHPDELRIDLDPQPGTTFDDARDIALQVVRPLLDELGLVGFPKTSGGRGVHVYVRIEPRWTFTEVRRAAIAFAREVERGGGGRVTTAWWKEQRGEQIFVDYNQNARDRTIASAYSVRKTPRATVSTPVTWDELVDVHPEDCTMATVAGLLAERGDPMADIDARAFTLDSLLDLAERDEGGGLGDLPYPPNYPKMPGEPKRVQPSRDTERRDTQRRDTERRDPERRDTGDPKPPAGDGSPG